MFRNLVDRSWALTKLLGLCAVIAFLSGCFASLPEAPATVEVQSYRYLIGPGDTLNVQIWRNPELATVGPVRPDGSFSIPLAGELVVAGKESGVVAREIEKMLAKYIRDPIVTVGVTGFVGPYSEQIRVIGEAAKPQTLPYRHNMTVLDVMITVGGLTDFANGNSAKIVRGEDGETKEYRVRLKDLIKRGDMSANVEMRPGDLLVIPQSWF